MLIYGLKKIVELDLEGKIIGSGLVVITQ